VRIASDPYTDTAEEHATVVEPSVAANGSMVVASFQVARFAGGFAENIGFSTSLDGGATWTSGMLPSLTTASVPAGPYARVADTSVAFDAAHDAWLIVAEGVNTGVPDAVVVSRSSDGLSWSAPVLVDPQGDKPWITCDNTPSSPYYGHCYALWAGANSTLMASVSTDGGATWGTPIPTVNSATGYDVQPVVRPDGTVVVVATSGPSRTSLISYRSTNGGASWTAAVTFATQQAHTVVGMKALHKPTATGDGSGRIYAAWEDCRFRSGCSSNDLVLATSSDGVSWTPPVRIPLDPVTSTVDHFLPSLGADRTTGGSSAEIGLVYYFFPTASCTSSTCQLEVAYVASGDGGASWSSSTVLSPQPMNIAWLASSTGGRMVGDYFGVAFSGANAVPVFALANPTVQGPGGTTIYDEAIYASVLAPPAPQAPQNTAPPAISGAAQAGSTVTADPGTWSGTPAPSFAYQWQRCDSQGANCTNISSATGSSYTPGVNDVGSTLRAVVTGSNSSGSASAASAAAGPVAAAQGPVTPLLDDFNRANGPLGSNWGLVFGGFVDFSISNNELADPSASSYAWDYWKAQQFGPASEAYVTVKTASGDAIRVCARMLNPSTSGRSGYCVNAVGGAWTIRRIDNGTATTLGATVNQAITAGDRISIAAIGSAISGWYFSAANGTWTQLLTRTDTTYAAGGYLALESRASHLDNFGGGAIP
jgi:hypothetical protein